jgi:hypothetical protein
MDNELQALKEDYKRLLIQVQAEMVQKEHYKIKLSSCDELLKMSQARIDRLVEKLELSNNNYQCLAMDSKREL